MTNRPAALALTLLAGVGACTRQNAQRAAPPDTAMSVVDSFRTPESVLYDSALDVYLVSNINGSPLAKDDNGFISRVSPAGRVELLRWIDGGSEAVTLNAPKGMAIKGDTLFVADLDELRMFDRTTGVPLGARAVRSATFLNDVAVGPDGTVYVTDSGLRAGTSGLAPSGSDAVYRFDASGNAVTVIRGDSLGRPNGIVPDETGLVVVTFGSGDVYHLDAAGRRTALPRPPAGQLDGIVRLADGSLLISSWEDSSVVRVVPPATTYTAVVRGVEAPADIGYDTRRSRILIPVFTGNRVEIRPLP
ncbi:MAG: SMP-30/gluconolactonase/LRE family protein [Gemmatimonadetes bacterium]|nr:SMP-30/gluconolactonase/LRE family protein [Gemmatimonadota bacterium]